MFKGHIYMKKLFLFLFLFMYTTLEFQASKMTTKEALRKALEPSVQDQLFDAGVSLKLPPHALFLMPAEELRKNYASASQGILVETLISLRQTQEGQKVYQMLSAATEVNAFVDPKISQKVLLQMKLNNARQRAQNKGRH